VDQKNDRCIVPTCYGFRGDTVQVDTWVAAAGKNGMRRDWHVRDYNSGRTILRATRFGLQLYSIARIICIVFFMRISNLGISA
jgi:hypothetical protein